MSFDADGTDLVVLDSDIFGDGDGDSQALDVFICQRLRGNQYWLNREQRGVSRSFFNAGTPEDDDGDYTGERPRASISPAADVVIPIKLRRGLESVTLRLLVNVSDQNSDDSGVDYRVQVRDQNRSVLGDTSGTLTNNENGFSIEEITCSLTRTYEGSSVVGEIVLITQSQDAGDTGSNISIADTQGLRWTASSSGFLANQSTGPNASSIELRYLQADNTGTVVDIFALDDTGGKTSDDVIFPDRTYTETQAVATAGNIPFSIRHMTYMQLRSVEVQLTYAADRFGRVGLGSLAAKQTVKGPLAITQAEAINQYDRAARMVSWGPDDYFDSRQQSASWPTNFQLLWPISHGDGSAHTVIDDTIMCVDENPTFEVVIFAIASIEIGGGVSPGAFSEGRSDWIFDVTCEQFDTGDSDWSTPTSLGTASLTRPVRTFPNDWRQARFFRTKTILHDFSGATGSLFAGNVGPTDFDDWQFACKEGKLFEEDFAFITPITLPVSTTLSYSNTLTPIRLRVDATYDDGTLEGVSAIGDVTAASVLDEAFHLTVVGYSIYEVT